MSNQGSEPGRIQAVDTACAIIELLDGRNGAGVSEVANEISVAKSTAHDHLNTLLANEYLVKRGGKYHLSLKFLKHGISVRTTTDLYEASQPVIDRVAEETGTGVWVATEEHGWAIYVNKALGERAIPTRGKIGARLPLHSSAIGKAILAYLPEEQVEEIIEHRGLPNLTENTITDPGELFKHLENIREQGIAFNKNESLEGLKAVASPIKRNGEIVGAVAIAGTDSQMSGKWFQEEIPRIVKDAANEIELNLTYTLT